jgi:putative SOS response-associated peptidase YedK
VKRDHAPPAEGAESFHREAGKEILRPFPAEAMKSKPISTRINKPENNDPALLDEEREMEQVGQLL